MRRKTLCAPVFQSELKGCSFAGDLSKVSRPYGRTIRIGPLQCRNGRAKEQSRYSHSAHKPEHLEPTCALSIPIVSHCYALATRKQYAWIEPENDFPVESIFKYYFSPKFIGGIYIARPNGVGRKS